MKTIISSLLFLLIGINCFAQDSEKKDSIKIKDFDRIEKQLYYDELFNFADNSLYGGILTYKSTIFTEPLFPEENWKIDYSALKTDFSVHPNFLNIGFSPFISSLNITNQASYKVNDRFSIGGNSYVGRSIYDPVQTTNSFDSNSIRGASMFLNTRYRKR